MKSFKWIRGVLVTGVLLMGIVALLASYLVAVSDLPSKIYTESQQEFLAYNTMRSVQQDAPVLNYVQLPQSEMSSAVVPWQSSRVEATLVARYEEQEGVSVTLYDLDFRGEYRLAHSGSLSTTLDLFFPFPANLETLHNVHFLVDGEEPENVGYSTHGIHWRVIMLNGAEHEVVISYRADGANSFTYGLTQDQRTDVDIAVHVIGLNGSEVPKDALPASASALTEEGELWTWQYDALIADRNIHLDLPARLSFAQRVAQLQDDFRTLAWLAPILVVSFLVALYGVFYLDNVRLRVESYLLIGLGIALFYPLLTFLSGAIALSTAAVVALFLVSGLLVAFLSRAAGGQQVIWQLGVLLIVFLGFFSLGLLTAWRGLLLTLGGLILVGLFMLLYAKQALAPDPEPQPEPLPETGEHNLLEETVTEPDPEVVKAMPEPATPADHLHCPYCARTLDEDYAFCPGCGHDTNNLQRCVHCGHQQVILSELDVVYCVQCGKAIPS